jgi:mRNA interferase RelE/StbE
VPDYVLHVAKPATKQIKHLEKRAQRAVLKALERLERNPRPPKSEKIGGHPPFRRIRAGDFRIIYAIEDLTVIVLHVRDRKDAYKGLDNLSPQLATALIELAESTIEALPTTGCS